MNTTIKPDWGGERGCKFSSTKWTMAPGARITSKLLSSSSAELILGMSDTFAAFAGVTDGRWNGSTTIDCVHRISDRQKGQVTPLDSWARYANNEMITSGTDDILWQWEYFMILFMAYNDQCLQCLRQSIQNKLRIPAWPHVTPPSRNIVRTVGE